MTTKNPITLSDKRSPNAVVAIECLNADLSQLCLLRANLDAIVEGSQPVHAIDLQHSSVQVAAKLDVIERRIDEAEQPATEAEIAKALVQLIASYPNSNRNDLEAFAYIARCDLAQARPSRYQVSEGLRRLRTTSRFFPSIAEMIDAIKAIPCLTGYRLMIADHRRLESYRRLIREGASLNGLDGQVLAKARLLEKRASVER